ncbi:hypothetical protein KY358_01980 [Candidatus Woesearchaeota archaeon]|nr:hypothetical protein [Candidatus Woesearchaeota archaeon]
MAISTLTAAKISFILGITNIIGLLLVLGSCRCVIGIRPEKLSRSKAYSSFYRFHCQYWWFFIASVLMHSVFAITAFGNPFS